jgi:hypothetical protein
MPRLIPLAAVLLLASCASFSPDPFDTNAAVDANPLCASRPDHPAAPVSQDCTREAGVGASSARKGEPVDFRRDRDD